MDGRKKKSCGYVSACWFGLKKISGREGSNLAIGAGKGLDTRKEEERERAHFVAACYAHLKLDNLETFQNYVICVDMHMCNICEFV